MGFGSGGGSKFGSGKGDIDGDVTVRGTTPKLTIGDGGEEDTMLVFDGAAQDYRIGIDDGTDTLEIGHGDAHGTRAAIIINSDGDVTKIGTDTHTSGQFLKFDGSKFVLSATSGGTADSIAADNITAGDAAVTLATTVGDITLDAQQGDKNIVFKGTDGSSDITALTLSMADAGAATFNSKVIATELDISGDCDIDGTTNLDNTDIDGTLVVDGSNISLDSTSTLNIDNSNTSNGITIGTATSGVPISIGHTTSETTVNDNLTVTGDLAVNGDTTTFTSANSTDPLLIIKNTTNDANGARFHFVKDKGAAGADGDDIGVIDFIADDAAQAQTTFARIVAEVSEADDGDEAGKLSFFVAESDSTTTALAAGLVLEGEHATDGEVDVTIGAGAASTTTIAGTLTMGSTAAMTNAGLLSVGNQSNVTGTGALDSGSITSGFGAIDNGTSGIRTSTFTAETAFVPDAQDGASLGTSSLQFSDLFLADSAVISFGDDNEITLTHSHNDGLVLESAISGKPIYKIKSTNSTRGTSGELQFLKDATGEDDEALGKITFRGQDDGDNNTEFASIFAEIHDATDSEESGRLSLQVASHDGGVEPGLVLEGGANDAEVNVTIGNTTTSVTTIAGTLELGDRNITNVGDIDCDSISVADAANGLTIDASGANSGTAAILLKDNVAQAFAVLETSGGPVTYMGFATTNGSELITASKPVEIEIAASDTNAAALLIDNNDTNQHALHIEAANIDADVIQLDATALTTGKVIDIDATGGTCVEAMRISQTYTDTTAVTSTPGICALHIDYEKSGNSNGNDNLTGIFVDMDNTTANGGAIRMRGLHVTPTLQLDASEGAAGALVVGADFTVTGGTTGANTLARGLTIDVSGADFNQGIHLKSAVTGTPDSIVGNHMKLISGASDTDTFQISVLANGETVLKTVDSGSSGADRDAHLHIQVDGDINMRTNTATAAGAGADAGSVITTHNNVNGQFTTTIQLDIAGLKSKDADNKIVGEAAGGAAYLTKIETTKMGRVYKIEMICTEAPTTGEPDIDLIASTADNLAFDSAEGTNDLLIDADGDWTIGKFKDNLTIGSTDLNNKFVYLSTGTAASPTEGVYGAGKYLIIFHGA